MANGMTFQLGADVSQALQAMTAVEQRTVVLQQRIESLQKVIGSTSSVQKLNQAMNLLGKSQAELSKITAQAGQSLGKVAPGSDQATQSLINLSRVAQDAPYGFIGIANNLNPLLESFQRLKATTGTTGGALKALTGVLAGPAGIGLALGVASSLLITFGDKLFGASKASKEAEENIKKLGEGVANDLVKVTSLVGLADNLNASYENRKKALQALNEQYGKYLPGLEKEQITLDNLKSSYDTITETLIRQAVVKGSQAEIEKIVAETAKEIIALRLKEKQAVNDATEAYKKQNQVNEFNESNQSKFDRYVKRVEESNGIIKDGALAAQENQLAQQQQIRTTNIYDVLVKKLTADLKDQLKPLMSLTTEFNDLGETLGNVEFVPTFVPKPKKVDQYLLSIARETVKGYRDAVTSVLSKQKAVLPLNLELFTPQRIKKLIDEANAKRRLEYLTSLFNEAEKQINTSINGIRIDALGSLGEGIGQALSGGGLKSVFSGFVDTIAGGVVAIGKQMIALGIKAALLKNALKSLFQNPIALVAAGVGLVAVGTAIRGALSKGIQAREKGGPVSGNTPYLVGERGPELFVPSVGGSIIPNNRMSSFSGRPAFATSGGGRSMVRGNDILLAYARTQRSQNRVNA